MSSGPYFRDDRSRQRFRADMLAKTPSWYSPWGHLGATVGIGLVVLVLAIWKIGDLQPLELLTVPITFVWANLFEWHAHRHLLHHRWKPMAVLYERHTPEHHRVYRFGDMAIRSLQEFRLVLIPAMGVLGIVLLAAPVATLAGWLITPNVGWLFLVTASLYVVGYELTHLLYHLPESTWIYRLGVVRVLREHHARHHHPPLMQKWNFNVTVPLADWLLRTMAPRELVEKARRDIQAKT